MLVDHSIVFRDGSINNPDKQRSFAGDPLPPGASKERDLPVLEIRARHARFGLQLLQPVLENDAVRNHGNLIDHLATLRPCSDEAEDDALRTIELWGAMVHSLACLPEPEMVAGLTDVDRWRLHILESVLMSETPVGRLAQSTTEREPVSPSIMRILSSDLSELQWVYKCDTAYLANKVARVAERAGLGGSFEPLPADFMARARLPTKPTPLQEVMLRFAKSPEWGVMAGQLVDSYREHGTGAFARFRAFRWTDDDGGKLEGVSSPDHIRLSELIGYDVERRLLLENTAQFVAGFAANNVLVYGDRGTGKSSTVKALFNEFQGRGLRLVEVPTNRLADFPRIIGMLRGKLLRFIVFVDDLSYGEKESGYTELKALLEGGLEAQPTNVLLYATSNRRHLVQERFSDRSAYTEDDDPRRQDTLQEKLSLSDRFGITVIFVTPDQERYLEIVRGISRQRGLAIEPEELRRQALQWASRHNGLSGRTARQFVDQLAGRLAFQESRSSTTND